MARHEWLSTQVLAWTDSEGPSRPPRGARTGLWTATTATLGIVFSVMLFTDALCAEHRAWVETLAGLALVGIVTSIVGLIKGWPSAPLITAGTAAAGVAIGLIDAIHSPLRGGFIATAFVVTLVLSAWLTLRQVPLLRWDRRLRRDTAEVAEEWPAELPVSAPSTSDVTSSPEVPTRQ